MSSDESRKADPVRYIPPAAEEGTHADDSIAEPASPCISVCALDANDVCMGCYRTATEITDWFMASAEEKRAIVAAAEARRRADSPIRLL